MYPFNSSWSPPRVGLASSQDAQDAKWPKELSKSPKMAAFSSSAIGVPPSREEAGSESSFIGRSSPEKRLPPSPSQRHTLRDPSAEDTFVQNLRGLSLSDERSHPAQHDTNGWEGETGSPGLVAIRDASRRVSRHHDANIAPQHVLRTPSLDMNGIGHFEAPYAQPVQLHAPPSHPASGWSRPSYDPRLAHSERVMHPGRPLAPPEHIPSQFFHPPARPMPRQQRQPYAHRTNEMDLAYPRVAAHNYARPPLDEYYARPPARHDVVHGDGEKPVIASSPPFQQMAAYGQPHRTVDPSRSRWHALLDQPAPSTGDVQMWYPHASSDGNSQVRRGMDGLYYGPHKLFTPRANGQIKSWGANGKYGFIRPDDSDLSESSDIFVHRTQILQLPNWPIRDLKEGDKVNFCPLSTPKGFQAVQVILLEQIRTYQHPPIPIQPYQKISKS